MALSRDDARQFADSILEVLRQAVAKEDRVSLVLWSRHKTEHVSFTSDLAPVEKALDRYVIETSSAQLDQASDQREYLRAVGAFERQVQENLSSMNNVATLPGREAPPAAPTVKGAADTHEGAAAAQTTSATLPMMTAWLEMKLRVAAINSTIDTMASAEGKKVLLLATRRLGLVAGGEFAYIAGAERTSLDARQRFGTEELTRSIVDSANSSGVTIYPMFAEGLKTTYTDAGVAPVRLPPDGAGQIDGGNAPGADARTLLNETMNLTRIAERTGGLMAASVADIVRLMPQVESDMTDYYSLAYRVSSDRADRTRDIVVRTRRGDYTVRARRQFVEKSDVTRMKDRLTAALFGAVTPPAIGLSVETGAPRQDGKRTSLPLVVRIPIKALTPIPQGQTYNGAFSVYLATANDLDELSDFTQKTQPFQFAAADLDRAQAGYFTYDLDLVVNPKARYAAVGVLDEVSKAWGVIRLPLGEAREPQSAAR
jgi:VWFA-related protein